MRALGLLLPFVLVLFGPSASAGEADPGADAGSGPERKFDDRVVFEQARRSAAALGKLIPSGRDVAGKTKAFDDKRLVARLKELSDILKAVDESLKMKDEPEAIVNHRRTVKKRIEAFLAEMEAYKKAYGPAAEAERELARLKMSSPRMGRQGNRKNNQNDYKRWVDDLVRARKRARTLTAEMNRRRVRAFRACAGVVSTLASIRASVRRIYETVIEKPVEVEFLVALPEGGPGDAPQETGQAGGAPAAARDSLLEGSACTPEAFRKAVRAKDRDFLVGLAGRIVIWRVIPFEPVKVSDKRLTVRVMAAGSPVTVELPPRSRAAGLDVGASVVVAGEVRCVPGEWLVHAVGWGAWGKVASGGAMGLCEWPEAK